MGVERCGRRIIALCVHVIEEQPHTHTTVSRFEEGPRKNLASKVIVQKIILSIYCLFSGLSERYARCKRFFPVPNQFDPGATVAWVSQILDCPCKLRPSWLFRRVGRRLFK